MVITNWAEIVKSVGAMFSGKVSEAVVVVEEQASEVKEVVGDGFDDIAAKQKELEAKVDAISNHKDDIIQEIRAEKRRVSEQGTTSDSQTVEPEEEAKPFKIMPSAPLSDDDSLIIEQDTSLYSQERKRSVIRPSSE